MMITELETLVKKFQSHRTKNPGKKQSYPARLRKEVARVFSNDIPRMELAKALGGHVDGVAGFGRLRAGRDVGGDGRWRRTEGHVLGVEVAIVPGGAHDEAR